jgi:hypothetical protein
MAYKKRVQGRMYPFLYNVTFPVGAYKSLKKDKNDYIEYLEFDPASGSHVVKKKPKDKNNYVEYLEFDPASGRHIVKKKPNEQYTEYLEFDPASGSHVVKKKPVAMHPVTTLTSKYQPNKRDDVMLVQYLLKRVYQQGQNAQPPLKSGVGDPHSPASLTIDGVYGPKTQSAIEKFQLEMRRNGQKIATDGCVDPEKGESSTASISKTEYTISLLNKYFWQMYPTIAPDIRVDPECPIELKQAVSNV